MANVWGIVWLMDKSVSVWLNNKELFLSELAKGRKWELHVAKEMAASGYDVEIPEYGSYNMPNDPQYKNSHDLLVNGHVVEVKSRNLDFTTPDSFPYPTIFVKNKATFDKVTDRPVMVVCVSQKSGSMVALDVKKTYQEWSPIRFFDRVRKIHTTAYECSKKLWEPLEDVAKRVLT